MDKSEKCDLTFFSQTTNLMDCIIFECEHFYGDTNWKFTQITSPYNRLYFVLAGEGFIQNEQETIRLKPGSAYIIPSNTTNDYSCPHSIEKVYIHFRMELFNFKDVFETAGKILTSPFNQSLLLSHLNKVKPDDWVSIIAFKAFIMEQIAILSLPLANHHEQSLKAAVKYQEVINFIKTSCTTQLTPQKIATSLNMPLTLLVKNFKNDLGFSLRDYMNSVIIQSAQDQLLLTDLLIKEISYNLGFTDEFYFSRFFKKHTTVSPKYYRKQNKLNF